MVKAPESQPQTSSDIHIERRSPGRPSLLPLGHEETIAAAIKDFADNNTPLTRTCVRDLIKTYVDLLPPAESRGIKMLHRGPSDTCINNILKRHGLRTSSVQVVEDKRLLAITSSNVTEHIARVQAALDRYNIRDARCILNVDQSGSSFARMVGRSLRKGIGKPGQRLQQSNVRTKGQLDRVTIMPVVSTAGSTFKPVTVYPGKNPHYRKVRGHCQELTAVLPEFYLFYREVPGVDTPIMMQWARNFVDEICHIRINN